jgi:hypothetical protein
VTGHTRTIRRGRCSPGIHTGDPQAETLNEEIRKAILSRGATSNAADLDEYDGSDDRLLLANHCDIGEHEADRRIAAFGRSVALPVHPTRLVRGGAHL